MSSLSFQRGYYGPSGKIYPFLTAIINVNQGVVQGITWDDACVFCSKDECERNTFDFNGNMGSESEFQQPVGGCFVTKEQCDTAVQEGRTDCDLVLYVVWSGTDANGNGFQSSANRFSEFPAQELSDRFSQIF